MARRGPVWWLLGLGVVAGLVFLRAWDPSRAGFEICVFRKLLDLPCPGCGLTRSIAALARGSLSSALDLHPLGPVFVGEAAVVWALWGWFGGERWRVELARHAEVLAMAHFAPLLALWLGRAATGTLPF